jgi:chitodextrinase
MPKSRSLLALAVTALICLVPSARAWATQNPIAAYSFDEGTGTTLGDSSGNARNGSIIGATWTSGKFGSALNFDGTSRVDLPALGTFYKSGFTLETWIKRASAKNDVGIVGSWNYPSPAGGPMLWVDWISGRTFATLSTGNSNYLDSTTSAPVGTWEHIAATYDGATARFYVNGTLVASKAFAGNVGDANVWRIGAYGATPGGFFDGVIDETRIYDRAITAAEVTSDMNTAVRNDTTAPTTPTAFAKTGATGTTIATGWTASTDNVGVAGYRMYVNGSQVGTSSTTTYNFSGLTCATSYTLGVEAYDSGGNTSGRATITASTGACDATSPTVAMTAPANGATVTGSSVTVSANASDNDSVAGVQFKLDGANLGAEDTTAPYSMNWDTTTTTPGAHTLSAVARDPSGNSAGSAGVNVTVTGPPPTPPIAAYAFDDASGTTASDSSGNNRNGTIVGATWTTGKFGAALNFDGNSSRVDLPALGTFYDTAFTLEAWVKKATTKVDVGVVGSWNNGGPMLWVDHIAGRYYATLNSGMSNYLDSTKSPTIGTWQHIAATYDGTTAKFYVDGALVASKTFTDDVGNSNNWRIGAYGGTPGGFFDGTIDEVRIYDRALTAGQVTADMNTAIRNDTTAPSAPTAFAKTGSTSTSISASWTASTDNVAVAGYKMYVNGSQVDTNDDTTYTFTGLTCNTSYTLGVAAYDSADNTSTRTNLTASTGTCDTTAPNVTITSPTAGTTVNGTVTVAASASDNDRVASVQFKLDGANLDDEDTTEPFSIDWASGSATPGSHTLTAVARDPSGNSKTSAPVTITVPPPPPGPTPVAAYSFDEAGGTVAGDATGHGNNGTITGTTSWGNGKFGGALNLDGISGRVDLPGLGTFYKGDFTLEAWIKRDTSDPDNGIVGTWNVAQGGGPMLWVGYPEGNTVATVGSGSSNYADAGSPAPVGTWTHVASTYDGSTLKLYVNGALVASKPFTGNVGDSNNWRIGAYGGTAGDFFDGLIDEVRIYDTALTAGQIGSDMNTALSTRPTVLSVTPQAGATDQEAGPQITAKFNQAMASSSISTTTFQLRDASNTLVPATVSYDAASSQATLKPNSALTYGATYTATLKSGASGVTSPGGGTLAADKTWSFTVTSRPPILLVDSDAAPFSVYTSQILKAEGIADYTSLDLSLLSSTVLSGFDQVVLGDVDLTTAQVTMLTNFVNGGGRLLALRPDKKLASLLGLFDLGTTLPEGSYMKVNTASGTPGEGIVSDTIQFHGTADRYFATSATTVATLYSTETTATSSPAVTIRNVGSGMAAAFTFDLARSIVYTRQGNPSWAGQERDGVSPIRPDDMFFGAKAGDLKPDWVDLDKVSIPQADETQRLFANVLASMAKAKTPLPRFWYLPRSLKAAVVMTGDDHAIGGTAGRFNQYLAASPAGCSVADWECVRSTSYLYPGSQLTAAQADAFQAQGFEMSLHYSPAGPNILSCANWTPATLGSSYDAQHYTFKQNYPAESDYITERSHCVSWSDWATFPKLEANRGIRLDTNYYYYPSSWMSTKPGFMTGSGMPMRFADLDGTTIDVFQANTVITDESGQAEPATINSLLDNALGAKGFYGAFVANIHTDNAVSADSNAIIAAAQARDVPVISAEQLAKWTDGRDKSSFSDFARSGNTVNFDINADSAARGLTAMLPRSNGSATLTSLKLGSVTVPFTTQTIKGVSYAFFTAASGRYTAVYS